MMTFFGDVFKHIAKKPDDSEDTPLFEGKVCPNLIKKNHCRLCHCVVYIGVLHQKPMEFG